MNVNASRVEYLEKGRQEEGSKCATKDIAIIFPVLCKVHTIHEKKADTELNGRCMCAVF